jgi:hypothetical protein
MNANLYKNIMTQLKFVFNQNNWRIILFNFDKHLHRESSTSINLKFFFQSFFFILLNYYFRAQFEHRVRQKTFFTHKILIT